MVLDAHGVEYRAPMSLGKPRGGSMRGTPGFHHYGGTVENPAEYQAAWKDVRTRMDTIERMRFDPNIKAALEFRVNTVSRASWSFSPPGTEEEPTTDLEQAATDWANETWEWRRLIKWLMAGPTYGFAVVEGEFARDKSGLLCPNRWEFRKPYRIAQAAEPWEFDPRTGRVVTINQDPSAAMAGRMPSPMDARNCIIATYNDEGDPAGESIMRAVYGPWDRASSAQRYEMIAGERFASPMPMAEAVETEGGFHHTVKHAAEVREAMTRIRTNHESGAVIFPGWKISAFGVSNAERVSMLEFISLNITEMMTGLGVAFLRLGQDGSGGAFALGADQSKLALGVIESDATWLGSTIQEQQADPLFRFNFEGLTRMPQLSAGDIRSKSIQETIANFQAAATAGAIRATDEDERWIRDMLGAPAISAVEIASRRDGNGDNDDAGGPGGGAAPSPRSGPAGSPDRNDDRKETPDPEEREVVEQSAHGGCSHELNDRAHAAKEHVGAFAFRRPPRGMERFVDFASADGGMNDGISRIIDATSGIRDRAADSLAAQAESVVTAGSIGGVKSIKVPAPIRAQMRKTILVELRKVNVQGRKSVRTELNRQRQAEADESLLSSMTFPATEAGHAAFVEFIDTRIVMHPLSGRVEFVDVNAPPSDPKNTSAILGERARRMTERALTPLEEAAQDTASRMLSSGGTVSRAPEAAFVALLALLKDRSLRSVGTTAGFSIPQAFNIGRDGAVRQEEGEFVAHYSTMLDGNVCSFCRSAEETSSARSGFVVDSAEYNSIYPPLQANSITGEGCEGDGRCRCIMVFERIENRAPLPDNVGFE